MKIIPWSWHEASENCDAIALLRPYQKRKKIRLGPYVPTYVLNNVHIYRN